MLNPLGRGSDLDHEAAVHLVALKNRPGFDRVTWAGFFIRFP